MEDSKRGKYISFLPHEILLMIFKLTYMMTRIKAEEERDLLFAGPSLVPEIVGDYPTMWDSDDDLLSPTIFPYALASVCSSWRNILSSVPAFWTRLMITVDSGPLGTSTATVKSYLERSADLPLNVTLGREYRGDDPMHDSEEQARVKEILDLIIPHAHRIRLFHINVLRSSSLPVIGGQLCGSFPLLITLILECEADDRDSGARDALLGTAHTAFSHPSLRTLAIDGFNFMRMRRIHGDWTTNLAENLQYLTIAFAFPPETTTDDEKECDSQHETIEFYLFLEEIIRLRELRDFCFNNIPFDLSVGHNLPYQFPEMLDTVEVSSQSSEILAELFRSFRASSFFIDKLKVTHCNINEISPFSFPDSTNLIFTDLDASSNISRILNMWYGAALTVDSCPSFDDTVLKMMGEEPPMSAGCSKLGALGLRDCQNFSVAALKRMVQAKEKMMEQRGVGGMEMLVVTGAGPEIGEEDLAWFESHVPQFVWDATPEEDGEDEEADNSELNQ